MTALARDADRANDATQVFTRQATQQLNVLSAVISWVYVGQAGAPALTGGWSYFGAPWPQPRFGKDGANNVHLSGLVKGGTVGFALADAIFVLPAGYRPLFPSIFVVSSNGAFGEVRIGSESTINGQAGGDVVCVIGNNAYVSLDGICFPAEQ